MNFKQSIMHLIVALPLMPPILLGNVKCRNDYNHYS